MKVKELIEKLQQLEQNREVYFLKYDSELDPYAGFMEDVLMIKEYNKMERCYYNKVEEDGEFNKIDKEDYIITS